MVVLGCQGVRGRPGLGAGIEMVSSLSYPFTGIQANI